MKAELIHEIHDIFERYESEAGYGGIYERPHKYSEPMWEEIIARIGKAYADGELKIPGEEWRADFRGYMDREAAVIDGHLTNWEGDELKPICRLIALAP